MFVSHIQGTGMSPHGARPVLQDSQGLQRGRPPWAPQDFLLSWLCRVPPVGTSLNCSRRKQHIPTFPPLKIFTASCVMKNVLNRP